MPERIIKTTERLVEIKFDQFRVHNQNPREAFQDLCNFLFCRRYGISSGPKRFRDQAGVEVCPVRSGKHVVSYQSKFFDTSIDWEKLSRSLLMAGRKHPELNKLIFYVNKEFSQGQTEEHTPSKNQKDLESTAIDNGIEIEWVWPSHFEMLLNQPRNLDLAQLYFGAGDELGFIRKNADVRVQTFLQTDEYLCLPLVIDGKTIKYPARSISARKQKSFLITGHPGCGKSIFVHYLFRQFGGLNKRSRTEMIRLLVRNQAVPMLINLKDCGAGTLEDLIRSRQNDANVGGSKLGFIYLLDGLDELSEGMADQTLSFVRMLEQREDTKKLIISCRSGNLNRLRARDYIPHIIELRFADLDESYIDQFFDAKKDERKCRALRRLRKENPQITAEIKDILLVILLWDTVEQLGPTSAVVDLIEQKVRRLLCDPEHRKNIDALNLLDNKSEKLLQLNQEIAFTFQGKHQYRFSREELQDIIQLRFPGLDYRSVNELLNYLGALFFDNNSAGDTGDTRYVYQHRRYQEFFLAQKLKQEYESDPTILRRCGILPDRDFVEGLLLPYMRRDYERKENIVGLLDLNLIDVYLGKHRGFGVDDAYYKNSPEFIKALALQSTLFIEEFLEGESFHIQKAVFVDLAALRTKFEEWRGDKNDYRVSAYLSSVWENGVSALLQHIVVFGRLGRKDIARKLIDNLNEVSKQFDKEPFLKEVADHLKPRNPYWKQWEDYLYLLLGIQGDDINDTFEDRIRGNYQEPDDHALAIPGEEVGNDKLLKSFYRVVLRIRPDAMLSDLDRLSDIEVIKLLEVLCSFEFLGLFIRNESLRQRVASQLRSRKLVISENQLFVAFYKKFLGIRFTKSERELLLDTQKKLLNESPINWQFREVPFKLAIVSFAHGVNESDSLATKPNDKFRYYNELTLYSALFASLIEVLRSAKTLAHVIRLYMDYCSHHGEQPRHYLKLVIAELWSWIFSASAEVPVDDLIALKQRLMHGGTDLSSYDFYYKLCVNDKPLFDRIVNESDFAEFEGRPARADDYQTIVNECFALAMFYSKLNEDMSRTYFIKGLTNSVLRHGWRKDTLVSYGLVDAIEILWKNNWHTREELISLTTEVFDLAVRVTEITDGSGTREGPYNLVDVVAKYDIAFAESLKERLIEHEGSHNFNNRVVTTVLLAKVRLGMPLAEIEQDMDGFHVRHDHDGKPRADFYEEMIRVYLALTESKSYVEEERASAFDKAYSLVDQAATDGVQFFLDDMDFRDLKLRYLNLCERYNKKPNVAVQTEASPRRQPKISEDDLVKEIRKACTKARIRGLYRRIQNYENAIVLSQRASWQTLLRRTYDVLGNIRPFIEWLEQIHYPHTDFYTSNSAYAHYGLAAALSDMGMKPEAIKYLRRNTGHGGFVNMMKVYEVIGDKQMARKLFHRYLQLCHFLVE